MRGLRLNSTLVSLSSRCTVAKCSRQGAHSESRIDGACRVAAIQPGFFAIQNAQRIAVDAPLAVAAQYRLPTFKNASNFSRYCGRQSESTERIYLQCGSVKPTSSGNNHGAAKNLRVDKRIAASQRFGADLVELAHAPFLWPLAAKHRPHVIELAHRLDLVHLGFDIGAHDPGGAFRRNVSLMPSAFSPARASGLRSCTSPSRRYPWSRRWNG